MGEAPLNPARLPSSSPCSDSCPLRADLVLCVCDTRLRVPVLRTSGSAYPPYVAVGAGEFTMVPTTLGDGVSSLVQNRGDPANHPRPALPRTELVGQEKVPGPGPGSLVPNYIQRPELGETPPESPGADPLRSQVREHHERPRTPDGSGAFLGGFPTPEAASGRHSHPVPGPEPGACRSQQVVQLEPGVYAAAGDDIERNSQFCRDANEALKAAMSTTRAMFPASTGIPESRQADLPPGIGPDRVDPAAAAGRLGPRRNSTSEKSPGRTTSTPKTPTSRGP